MFRIITAPNFWKMKLSRSISIDRKSLGFHYFVFSLSLAIGILMISDEFMEITTKIAWYFAAIVFYRLVMQTLLLAGYGKKKTAYYLNGFVVFSFLLPFLVLVFTLYKGFASYQL